MSSVSTPKTSYLRHGRNNFLRPGTPKRSSIFSIFLRSHFQCFFDFFWFFLEKRVHSHTGAQSTKITNLLFFDSRLQGGISPRVLRGFEKVIFLDFEVRKCGFFTQVFSLLPLKNTKNQRFLENIKKTHFLVSFLTLKMEHFLIKSPPGTPKEPPKTTQDPPKSLRG